MVVNLKEKKSFFIYLKNIIFNYLGCSDLVMYIKDMINNLLTHVKIMTLLSFRDHGGLHEVTLDNKS